MMKIDLSLNIETILGNKNDEYNNELINIIIKNLKRKKEWQD